MDRDQLNQLLAAGNGGPLQAQAVLNAIRTLNNDDGQSQVHASGKHPPRPGCIVEPVESPTRLLVVPTVSVAALFTTLVAVTVDFKGPGFGEIIGMRGSASVTATGVAADLESMEVRFNINGDEELVTDGQVQAFANFSTLFAGNAMYLPIRRRVTSTDRMNFFFQNLHAQNALVPHLTVFFAADKDVALDNGRR